MIEITLLWDLLPFISLAILYGLLFRKQRNRYVEAFLLIMVIDVILKDLLYFISPNFIFRGSNGNPDYPDSGNSLSTLWWLFVINFMYQFNTAMQEFWYWIMISFFSAIFGILLIFLRITLIMPLQTFGKNILNRIRRRPLEKLEYPKMRDRFRNLSVDTGSESPYDPEVVEKTFSESWRDYLIIGLVTLLPTALFGYNLITSGTNIYVLNALIFAIFIYRFGYPAANRLAKGANVRVGSRNIGEEMMKGTTGIFFKFNITITILSAIIIPFISGAVGTGYFINLMFAVLDFVRPILFAIILLPLIEPYSKKFFEKLLKFSMNFKTYVRGAFSIGAIKSLIVAFIAGTATFLIAFVTMASLTLTLTSAHILIPDNTFMNNLVNALKTPDFFMSHLPQYIWVVGIVFILLVLKLLLGVIGYKFSDIFKVRKEILALLTGLSTMAGLMILTPDIDFFLTTYWSLINYMGTTFQYVRITIELAPKGPEYMVSRMLMAIIVDGSIWTFTALFIMYYLYYRKQWAIQTGKIESAFLNLTRKEVYTILKVALFAVIVTALFVIPMSYLSIAETNTLINWILYEIAMPEGLEALLMFSPFVIIFEHNSIRSLLMIFIGPVMWATIFQMYLMYSKKNPEVSNNRRNIMWFIGTIIILILEYFAYDDQFTYLALFVVPIMPAAYDSLVKKKDFLIQFVKYSLWALPAVEVMSTMFWITGKFVIRSLAGELFQSILYIVPHGIIELPAFFFAAAAGKKLADKVSPYIDSEDYAAFIEHTKEEVKDPTVWRSYFMVLILFIISALIEAYLRPTLLTFFGFYGYHW